MIMTYVCTLNNDINSLFEVEWYGRGKSSMKQFEKSLYKEHQKTGDTLQIIKIKITEG
jgi:hypothetical protein